MKGVMGKSRYAPGFWYLAIVLPNSTEFSSNGIRCFERDPMPFYASVQLPCTHAMGVTSSLKIGRFSVMYPFAY